MHSHKTLVVGIAIAVLLALGSALPSSAQLNAAGQLDGSPMLSCSPAPCVFPPGIVPSAGRQDWSNAIAANPQNPAQILVATIDPRCSSGEDLSSSEDGGASWTPNCLPPLHNNDSGSVALLAYSSTGVAYAGTGQSQNDYPDRGQIVISSSTDNGRTWTIPRPAFTAYGIYAMRLEVDNSPTSSYAGSLYIAGGIWNSDEIVISHSHDGAKTWNSAVVDRQPGLYLRDYFPSVATGPDGTVYATWLLCKERANGEFGGCDGRIADIMFSKSTDGGDTWSSPAAIAYPRLAPGSLVSNWGNLPFSPVAVSEIPVVAVDTSNGPNAGNVYVAFYNNEGTYLKVNVISSRDAGQSWSAPVSVSRPRSGDQFNPWISVSSTGTIGVTWLQGQSNVDKYQPYFAVSNDGAATFTGDRPLASGYSDPSANPSAFGEFRTHVWAGDALYAVWQDNHTGGTDFQVAIGGVQF